MVTIWSSLLVFLYCAIHTVIIAVLCRGGGGTKCTVESWTKVELSNGRPVSILVRAGEATGPCRGCRFLRTNSASSHSKSTMSGLPAPSRCLSPSWPSIMQLHALRTNLQRASIPCLAPSACPRLRATVSPLTRTRAGALDPSTSPAGLLTAQEKSHHGSRSIYCASPSFLASSLFCADITRALARDLLCDKLTDIHECARQLTN
jgi:hypothetical protein